MIIELARRVLPLPIKNAIRAAQSSRNGFVRRMVRKGERERLEIAMQYLNKSVNLAKAWAKLDKETSNFYYALADLNKDQLTQLICVVTDKNYDEIAGYLNEIETDAALKNHIENTLKTSGYGEDIKVEFARRIGWYAFVRILKPKVVIETGVDHGVGACVITSALRRNAAEGFTGRYFGTDFNPSAGRLLTGPYAEFGEIVYGDSIETLSRFQQPIDLFINDSDHSAEYEYREYQTIKDKLTIGAVILGDNAHVTDKLSLFSRESGRSFLFFAEKPRDHWYPGAGLGISYPHR